MTIAGRPFVLGATYAPAEPTSHNGQRRVPRRLVSYEPPEWCHGWYAAHGGKVRVAIPSGFVLPLWSGEHWAEWAGEEVAGG